MERIDGQNAKKPPVGVPSSSIVSASMAIGNLTNPSDKQSEFKTPQGIIPHAAGGKAMAPSKSKVKSTVDNVNEYTIRRSRNNVAVKKSRERSKEKTMSTVENIERLKLENVGLEEKVEVLSKELTTLRKVFMDHAKGFSGGDDIPDIKQLEQLLGHKLTEGPTSTKGQSSSND